MNRREILKAVMVASGGLVALPVWARNWTLASISPIGKAFTSEEQDLLASVVDTIIPAGEAVGALSVGVDKFLQKLLLDCYTSDVQENVKTQLKALNDRALAEHALDFSLCEQRHREDLLKQFESSDEEKQTDFFKLMKSETIRGFTTSREVMVNYHKFNPVPGHYYGCVDVKA